MLWGCVGIPPASCRGCSEWAALDPRSLARRITLHRIGVESESHSGVAEFATPIRNLDLSIRLDAVALFCKSADSYPLADGIAGGAGRQSRGAG